MARGLQSGHSLHNDVVHIQSGLSGAARVALSMCSVFLVFLPLSASFPARFSKPGQATVVREAVMRQMCQRAAPHVDVTKVFKQFAIFLLHRDDFDDSPKWHSGDAKVSVRRAVE